MRQREERDGIKRTITLNKQFRMHSVLGKFVSETFYRPHGEEFESPSNTGQFEHNLERVYRSGRRVDQRGRGRGLRGRRPEQAAAE